MDIKKRLIIKPGSFKYKSIITCILANVWVICTVYGAISRSPVPLDPSILYGKLENGLTYYIKSVREKSNEMELRLLVKAGVENQDYDQYEMQHIVEHMAFKAGKNMTITKAHELGFNIGQINGSGSINFTKYTCKVRTTKQREIGFQLIQDIIWNLDIKNELIDSERSVLINEAMVRNAFDVQNYLRGLENKMLGRGSKPPEDLIEYFETFSYDPLNRFYKDWYRPDLMALIIVGDINNLESIEKEIKEKFSKLDRNTNSRFPIINYDMYINSNPKFIKGVNPYLAKGTKTSNVDIKLYMRNNEHKKRGLEFLRDEQIKKLFLKMLNNRQQEEEDKYASNYSTFSNYLIPRHLGLKLNINVEHGSAMQAISQNIQLLNQIRLFGFSHSEFIKSKTEHLISLKEKDTSKIIYWTEAIGNHFINRKPLPYKKIDLLYSMVKELSLTEFNQVIKEYIKTDPDDFNIILVAPPNHKILSYSEVTIRGWIAKANKLKIKTYNPPSPPKELLSPLSKNRLKNSTIQKKGTSIPGATEYRLGNGVRLVLKPNHTYANEKSKISLKGFQNIGAKNYPESAYFSAMNSTSIVVNSGVGGLNKYQLQRFLKYRKFDGYIKPYMKYDESGIDGLVSLEDLEIALQLIYLYFTAPNENWLAFEDWKSNVGSSNSLIHINNSRLYSTIKSYLRDYSLYSNYDNTIEDINNTDMHQALSIYKEIFSNAGGFTFLLTGDFIKEEVLSLCRKYLGNLPVNKKKYIPKSENIPSKQLPRIKRLNIKSKRSTPKAEVRLIYTSEVKNNWGWKEEVKAEILRLLVSRNIMQEIRFKSEDSGVYTIGVALNSEMNRLFNSFIIQFNCMPKDVDRLILESKKYITTFKNTSIDLKSFRLILHNYLSNLEALNNNNLYITKKIHNYYRYDTPWHSLKEEQNYAKALSPEDIQIFSSELLQNNPYEFIMK